MTLMRIRMELTRSHEFPVGSSRNGYVFTLPLDAEGRFDLAAFERTPEICTVHRFWEGEGDEVGQLMRIGPDRWTFSYRIGTEDDEAIPHLADHVFRPGEYISVREHDGRVLPFRVVELRPTPGLSTPATGRP
jgi:hypothetical protein